MVKHLSDDQLKKMTLGGHDPIKVYNAYKAAVEHKGAPTVILARTIKGYGLGEAGEGKNITHQQKKMNEEELRAFRTRFGIPISDAEIAQDAVLSAGRRQHRDPLHARAAQGARRLRAERARSRSEPLHGGPGRAVRGVLQGHRRPQGVDDDGVRAAAVEAAARQGDRPARRADRARRGAHLRHGGAVPRRSASTRTPARCTSRSTWTRSSITRKRRTARFSKKGSTKPARCRRSSPPAPPTRRTASTRSRSSSTTRCSASSGSAI